MDQKLNNLQVDLYENSCSPTDPLLRIYRDRNICLHVEGAGTNSPCIIDIMSSTSDKKSDLLCRSSTPFINNPIFKNSIRIDELSVRSHKKLKPWPPFSIYECAGF